MATSPTAWVSRGDKKASNTITFTGAANLGAIGTFPVFTVAGSVWVTGMMVRATTTLVGSGATIKLGTTNNVGCLIVQTTATLLIATYFWVNATPTLEQAPMILNQALAANVIGTVATANITAGVLEFVAYYRPLSSNGTMS